MAYGDTVAFVASGARTTGGNSGAIACERGLSLALAVSVTAASGTGPSMALTIEWSHDGATFVAGDPADGFTAITAIGGAVKSVPIKGPYFRLVWAITGTTPSFTFTASRYVTA